MRNSLLKIFLFFIFSISLLGLPSATLGQSGENTADDPIQEVPLTYFHIGGGFSMPGLFFSKDIVNALENLYEGDWRIQHLDFPVSFTGAIGVTNIVRAEYHRTATLFRHNIKYSGDITGFSTVFPYFEREYETNTMKYRDHRGLIKLNLLFPAWTLNPGEIQSRSAKNVGLFLIYGVGVVDYTDLDNDDFNWTGMSQIFGLGLGAVTTRVSLSADFKYSRINFEETPFSSFDDAHHMAGYFQLHISVYYGFGM